MSDKFENTLKLIVASQNLISDDRLSGLVGTLKNIDLFEEELELVAAARSYDYEIFIEYVKSQL